MIQVSIIVPDKLALINSIVNLFKILDWINDYFAQKTGTSLFNVHLVGSSANTDLYGKQWTAMPDLTLQDNFSSDLIFIPALAGNIAEGIANNFAFVAWLEDQYASGAEIVALCTGVLLLAETDLIRFKKEKIKWFVAAEFREEFSQISSVAKNICTNQDAVKTKGAFSYIESLVKKLVCDEAGITCADIFEAEFNRECQSLVSINNDMEKAIKFFPECLTAKLTMYQFEQMFYRKEMKVENCSRDAINQKNVTNAESIVDDSTTQYNNSLAFKRIFKKISDL
jgi:hypothetical protein